MSAAAVKSGVRVVLVALPDELEGTVRVARRPRSGPRPRPDPRQTGRGASEDGAKRLGGGGRAGSRFFGDLGDFAAMVMSPVPPVGQDQRYTPSDSGDRCPTT